jgi:hypothetical protein
MLDSGGDSTRIMASTGGVFRSPCQLCIGLATSVNGHENGDRKIG